jgi:hypothetical protein
MLGDGAGSEVTRKIISTGSFRHDEASQWRNAPACI